MFKALIAVALLTCSALPAAAAAPTTTIAKPPQVLKSTIEKTCGDKTYVLSTGTKKGTCGTGVTVAECSDGANSARATCSKGCESSTGAGSCTTK
jgi:hypothetical protein